VRILVTGSRNFTNRETVLEILSEYWEEGVEDTVLIHGGARGLDELAADVAFQLGWVEELHFAEWERFGKSAGHIRNQAMVDSGADVCIGFPMAGSRGTWDCLKRAADAGIPTRIF
jgi:hypothetical protein